MDAIRKLLIRQAKELRLDLSGVTQETPTIYLQARVMQGMRELTKELARLRLEEHRRVTDYDSWMDRAASYLRQRDEAIAERDELLIASQASEEDPTKNN